MSVHRPHGFFARLKKAWEPASAERAGHLRLAGDHLLLATLKPESLILELCGEQEGVTHTIEIGKNATAPFIHWQSGVIVLRYAGGMCRCHVDADAADVIAFFDSLPAEFTVFDRGYGRAA